MSKAWIIWIILGVVIIAILNLTEDIIAWIIALAYVAIWLLGGVVLCIVHAYKKHKKKINDAPLLTKSVTVISKLQRDEFQTYSISFEFPDRSRKEFVVKPNQYVLIREGDTGILRYKKINNELLFDSFQHD